ncbi:restriction endonuclease [Streptomyces sp. NPDC059002]|uniref:restriction endonuclease n=1 Tax=Streptomyces sp. NPDC059002 TaxID=3346690 RepID=UPI0036AE23CF
MTTDLPKHAVQALLSDDERGTVLADAVAAASETELHSAFFHACAWDIAADIFHRLTAHLDDISIEKHDAEQRGRAQSGSALHPASRHIREGSAGAARTLAYALQGEVAEATVAVEEASRVRSRIARGHEDTLAPPLSLLGIHPPSPLEALIAFHHQLGAARMRVNTLRAEDRRILHELAVEEELRRRAADARDGVALKAIDLYLKDDFWELIADLSEGVPHPVPGYDGRDQPVTASLSDGRPVVFFPQYLPVAGHADYRPPPLPALGLPEVHHLSGLAHHHFPETAVVVVTNGRFSPTAQRYAQSHDVQLLGREGLERWATWSSPLHTVLGSCEAHTDTEAVR